MERLAQYFMNSRPTLGCGDWWILLTFLTRKHSSRMRATALLTVADGIQGPMSRWVSLYDEIQYIMDNGDIGPPPVDRMTD